MYSHNFYVTTGICVNNIFYNDGNNAAICDLTNVGVQNNVKQKVPVVFPYGFGSLANDKALMVLFNSTSSAYGGQPLIIGSLYGLKYSFLSVSKGESYNYSNGWFLKYGNDSIQATKLTGNNIVATLPIGEWLGKILTDIITRLTQIENYNNTHTHQVGTIKDSTNKPCTGISGTPVTLLPPDGNLTQDQTAINNKNYLLCPTATLPS